MNTCIGAGNLFFYTLFRVFYALACLIAFSAFFSKTDKSKKDDPKMQSSFVNVMFVFFSLFLMAKTNFQMAADMVLHVKWLFILFIRSWSSI